MDAIDTISEDDFSNRNYKKTLTNKLNTVIEKLQNAEYNDTMNKLENDILKKQMPHLKPNSRGCPKTGY